jgi:hypothetical protein
MEILALVVGFGIGMFVQWHRGKKDVQQLVDAVNATGAEGYAVRGISGRGDHWTVDSVKWPAETRK